MKRRAKSFQTFQVVKSEDLEIILMIVRAAFPVVLMNMLLPRINAVYFSGMRLEIPRGFLISLTMVLHIIPTLLSGREVSSRGWLYEISRCFLASEVVLFIYFIPHQAAAAALLILVLLGGLLIVMTYGREQLALMYRYDCIPERLLNDIAASKHHHVDLGQVLRAAVRRYLVVVTALLLCVPSVMVVFDYGFGSVYQSGNQHAVIDSASDNQMIRNIGTIELFEENTWPKLTNQEKLDALQVVADLETNYMGIRPVTVVDCHLEKTLLGSYDSLRRYVKIDLEKHEGRDPIEYLNTIMHECRHAYQNDCVESIDWSAPEAQSGIYYAQARQWRHELTNYIHTYEDKNAYYNQKIEEDARDYADRGEYVYQQYLYLFDLPER